MVLVETDLLLALLKKDDRLHGYAKGIFKRGNVNLSPYALTELNALFLSGRLETDNYELFMLSLGDLLAYCDVKILVDKPVYHGIAWRLRRLYGLTYFDSLHAAVALTERMPIVSSDPIYGRVKGVKSVHPKDWTRERLG